MSAGSKVVTILVVIVFIAGFVLVRKPVRTAIGTLHKVEHAINVAERLQGLLEVNTAELTRISKEWERSQKEIEQLNKEIQSYLTEISDLQDKVDALPVYEIPDDSTVEPEDYQECLHELERSRLRGDTLVMVIHTQRDEITLLRALNTSQGLVITSQAEIIDKQGSYISEFGTLLKEHNKKANRRILIGTAVGFLVALIL